MAKTKIGTLCIVLTALLAACSDNSDAASPSAQELLKKGESAKREFPNKLWRFTLQERSGKVRYDENKTPHERKYFYIHNDEYFCNAISQKEGGDKFVLQQSTCKKYSSADAYNAVMFLLEVSGNTATYTAGKTMLHRYVLADDAQDPSVEEIVQFARDNGEFH